MRGKFIKLSKLCMAAVLTVAMFAGSSVSAGAGTLSSDEQARILAGLNESVMPDLVGDKGVLSQAEIDRLDSVSENQLVSENSLDEENVQYLTVDAFFKTTGKKGLQGSTGRAANLQHGMYNAFITYGHLFTGAETFHFEGETYHFSSCVADGVVRGANDNGVTMTMVFLLKYDPAHPEMVEPAAREDGHYYYAPNATDPSMIKRYRAYFEYLGEKYSRENLHIDNWVLGNEVNMPSQWNYFGTTDLNTCAQKYATTYMAMYNGVKKWTNASRVSICVDHSWQDNDEGRGMPAKDFLNAFNSIVGDIDWCIAYHMYPAILYNTNIWENSGLNPKSDSARFVDGNNLYVMTNYIKNTFGAKHRIMLTEQGFSNHMGVPYQAACLAYSYYAALYDDMVDCFLINNAAEADPLNFKLTGTALDVFWRMDSDEADMVQWVADYCLPIIGVGSWAEIVPNYGKKTADKEQVQAFVRRLYEKALGREAEAAGLADWTNRLCTGVSDGANAAKGFFFSDEFKNKNCSDSEYVELLYNVMMDRASDAGGKADWMNRLANGVSREGVYKGFAESAEFSHICDSYGITRGTAAVSEGRDRNTGLTTFVARLYTKALGRNYEVAGLNDWCNRVCDGTWSINDVSTTGFFNSQEFLNKNTTDDEYVKILYRTFFDREYDQAGYSDWMSRLKSGTSRNDVLMGFCNSQEFANLKAGYGL